MKLISSVVISAVLLSASCYASDWLSQSASAILAEEGYNSHYNNSKPMYNGPIRTIRCESSQYQRRSCRVPSVGSRYEVASVQKSRQLSKSPCNENQQWSFDGVTLFVQDGCRADFLITYEANRYTDIGPNDHYNSNTPQYPPGLPGAEKCRCDAELVITRAFMDYVRRKPTMDEVRQYRIRYIDQGWNEQQVRQDIRDKYSRRRAY